MDILRKQDLAVYYWVKDTVFSGITFINITTEFPQESLELPTVAVENGEITPMPWELGNPVQKEDRVFNIELFALTKAQADDFSYRILRNSYSGIPVYDYDYGFPPDITPPLLGRLYPDEISVTPVRVNPELVEKLYYRTHVRMVTEYSSF